MIVLDANVVSAAMGERRVDVVVEWLGGQPLRDLYLTAITVFEVEVGLANAPRGRRRDELVRDFRFIQRRVNQRILPLDDAAGRFAARIVAERKLRRVTMGLADTLLAGIAAAHGATIATRNVRHFADLPSLLPDLVIDVVNPWGPDDPGPDA